VNLNEVKAERNDVFVAAEALLAKARAKNQDLKGADLAQYNGLVASLKTLDAQIEQLSKHGAAAQSHTATPVGVARDTDGNRLPIFGKGQSIEAHMRQEDRKHPTARRTRLTIAETICEATAHAADDLDLRGIALFTVSGYTAKQLSKYHPSAPIFALSRIEATVNRLSLLWGTTPIPCGMLQTAEEMVDAAEELLAKGGYVRPREVIAIVAGTRTKSGSTNFMRLHVMGDNSQGAVRNAAASEETTSQASISLRRRSLSRRVAPDKESASRSQI